MATAASDSADASAADTLTADPGPSNELTADDSITGKSTTGKSTADQPKLPDPDAYPDRDVVLFDGECNFCRDQVQTLRRMDRGGRLAFLSLHDPRVAERYPNLSHDRLMSEMVVVDREGNDYGGSEAVKYLSRRLPMLWPAMPILHLPGTAGLWRWAYGQIAKRRYKLAGKCEDTCAVHFD